MMIMIIIVMASPETGSSCLIARGYTSFCQMESILLHLLSRMDSIPSAEEHSADMNRMHLTLGRETRFVCASNH